MNEQDRIEEFYQNYDSLCQIINSRAIFPRLEVINKTLKSLLTCEGILEKIDQYMIYNTLVLAKLHQKKLKQMNKSYQKKKNVMELNNLLEEATKLGIIKEKNQSR